jgi:hypothetical protein
VVNKDIPEYVKTRSGLNTNREDDKHQKLLEDYRIKHQRQQPVIIQNRQAIQEENIYQEWEE